MTTPIALLGFALGLASASIVLLSIYRATHPQKPRKSRRYRSAFLN